MVDAPAKPTDRFSAQVLATIRGATAANAAQPAVLLRQLLRLLAKWRAEMLRGVAIQATGGIVWSGPFAGMKFDQGAAEGCFLPKLFGWYESELHEHWRELAALRRYETIIDVGAAEGYYAVGLARLFPHARILARDSNPNSHALLRQIARSNGVADRIDVGGLFAPSDFAAYAGQRVLVLCDIEGAEKSLLDPVNAPALTKMDLVVEAHEGMDPTIPGVLVQRFAPTHDIVTVRERMRDVVFPPGFRPHDTIDRWLAVWEFRSSPTPWLVMRAREFPG